MTKFKRYLWLSQGSLLGLLLVCTVIMPSVAIKNGGVSNFGNHRLTIVPYMLSFGLSIIFLCLAAVTVLRLGRQTRVIAGVLLLLALLEFLVLLSTFPRHISQVYSDIHDDLGIVLFSYEFLLSLWLVIKRPKLATGLFLLLETIGSIIGLLSITKVIHFLFIGQMLGAIGFGLLLVTTLPPLIKTMLGNFATP